jgi:hypothetical protein
MHPGGRPRHEGAGGGRQQSAWCILRPAPDLAIGEMADEPLLWEIELLRLSRAGFEKNLDGASRLHVRVKQGKGGVDGLAQSGYS